jgi:hypothetical protein
MYNPRTAGPDQNSTAYHYPPPQSHPQPPPGSQPPPNGAYYPPPANAQVSALRDVAALQYPDQNLQNLSANVIASSAANDAAVSARFS